MKRRLPQILAALALAAALTALGASGVPLECVAALFEARP